MHRIVIVIHPGGRMTSQVEGIAGPSCTQASAWLDRLGRVVEHQPTADYYQAEVATEATTGTGGSHGDGSY